jgi:hypothetical protein
MQRAVDNYAQRAGQRPSEWATLVRARVLPGVPVDPSRTPYDLSADGHVGLSPSSPLWPLPPEPAALPPRPPS